MEGKTGMSDLRLDFHVYGIEIKNIYALSFLSIDTFTFGTIKYCFEDYLEQEDYKAAPKLMYKINNIKSVLAMFMEEKASEFDITRKLNDISGYFIQAMCNVPDIYSVKFNDIGMIKSWDCRNMKKFVYAYSYDIEDALRNLTDASRCVQEKWLARAKFLKSGEGVGN